MPSVTDQLLAACEEWIKCDDERTRMLRQYPCGTLRAENEWSDFDRLAAESDVAMRSAVAAARAQAEDDTKPLSSELLLSRGWDRIAYRGVAWPSIATNGGDLMQWRSGGMWIDETPIVLCKTWGDVRRLLEGLKVKPKPESK